MSPGSGPAAGGTSVTIAGSGFTGATDVSFGGTPAASYTVDGDAQITATSPAHAAATVDVTVTAPGGTSAISVNDEFTFQPVASGCTTACIGVGDATQLETDAGTHPMKFPVTLSEPATQTVTVDYTVVEGTATGGTKAGPGVDYKIKSGTIKFKLNTNKGVTPIAKTIAIPVYGDTDTESDETFTVVLSNPTGGYTIGSGTGTGDCGSSVGCSTGTIVNDDGIASGLTMGIGDTSIVSAHDGKQSIKLPVTLSDKALTTVTVDVTVTPGTATYSKKATERRRLRRQGLQDPDLQAGEHAEGDLVADLGGSGDRAGPGLHRHALQRERQRQHRDRGPLLRHGDHPRPVLT